MACRRQSADRRPNHRAASPAKTARPKCTEGAVRPERKEGRASTNNAGQHNEQNSIGMLGLSVGQILPALCVSNATHSIDLPSNSSA